MDNAYHAAEDSVARLFEPDIITPEQHYDRTRSERADVPEIRLMLAVMEDAVASYQRHALESDRHGLRMFTEIREWIESEDSSWPYSFENICTALRLEPDSLRRGLVTWREKQVAGKREVYRFPFRRVNGKRHSSTLRDRHARKSA